MRLLEEVLPFTGNVINGMDQSGPSSGLTGGEVVDDSPVSTGSGG